MPVALTCQYSSLALPWTALPCLASGINLAIPSFCRGAEKKRAPRMPVDASEGMPPYDLSSRACFASTGLLGAIFGHMLRKACWKPRKGALEVQKRPAFPSERRLSLPASCFRLPGRQASGFRLPASASRQKWRDLPPCVFRLQRRASRAGPSVQKERAPGFSSGRP